MHKIYINAYIGLPELLTVLGYGLFDFSHSNCNTIIGVIFSEGKNIGNCDTCGKVQQSLFECVNLNGASVLKGMLSFNSFS